MVDDASEHGSRLGSLVVFFMPASMALSMFFSWIILINGLKVPFYLYYYRTIFLIYVSRPLDPVIWLASSALALIMLAAGARGRPVSIWFSVAVLWLGIVTGALAVLGVVPQAATIAASATLTGCALGGIAALRSATTRIREYFILAFVAVVSVLLLPVELGSLSYYVLSAFHMGVDVGRSWEMLEMQLWYTAFPLVPFLYAAFLFSWIWAPLLAKIPWKSKPVARSNDSGKTTSISESRIWIVVMGCFVVMALPWLLPVLPRSCISTGWNGHLLEECAARRKSPLVDFLVSRRRERTPPPGRLGNCGCQQPLGTGS